MLSTARTKLKEAMCRYTTDTLTFSDTVRGFCKRISEWMLCRKSELNMMMDIKGRVANIDPSILQVFNSEGVNVSEYLKVTVTPGAVEKRRGELEKELSAVLLNTLGGLEELQGFLDAVEKLAVTSFHVFAVENQVLELPEGTNLENIQAILAAAQRACPRLLDFKRDAEVFFLPRLHNVEVLMYQLERYIQSTQRICEVMEKSDFSSRMQSAVGLREDVSDAEAETMLCHINQLEEIRKDQNFRMVFLFRKDSDRGFMEKFSEQKSRMLQFLDDLEGNAVQLDRMKTGAKISSVAGSSVGLVGGVFSIVGLALAPVTVGVSLGLTIAGLGMGITSGVNRIVTTATEAGVNHKEKKKAEETFKSFMEDVQALQDHLEEVSNSETGCGGVGRSVGKVLCRGGGVVSSNDELIKAISGNILENKEMIVKAGKAAVNEVKSLRNAPKTASGIPNTGQAAVKGPLALSGSARAGLIAVNALFIGMDAFFICKDSISLAKGTESETSQFIRARAALWRSQMDSWQKIHDSLCQGQQTSEKHHAVLETPFYPWMKTKGGVAEGFIPFILIFVVVCIAFKMLM